MCISHWSIYTCGHEGTSSYPLGIVRCSKVLCSANKNNVCVPIPEELHEEDVECPTCRSQKERMQEAKELSRKKVSEKKASLTAGARRKAEGEGEGGRRKDREDDEGDGDGTGKKVARESRFGRPG